MKLVPDSKRKHFLKSLLNGNSRFMRNVPSAGGGSKGTITGSKRRSWE
jgi:hypothetical protein